MSEDDLITIRHAEILLRDYAKRWQPNEDYRVRLAQTVERLDKLTTRCEAVSHD